MAILYRVVGPIIGLIFGLVFFWQGVGPAFAVLGFILVGWLIGMVVTGRIDLIGWAYSRTRGQRAESDRMDTIMRR